MKLHLKLAADAGMESARKVCDTASQLGATDVRQLFPDADDELATLFIVDLPADVDPDAFMGTLRDDEAVEAVEREVPRWLALE